MIIHENNENSVSKVVRKINEATYYHNQEGLLAIKNAQEVAVREIFKEIKSKIKEDTSERPIVDTHKVMQGFVVSTKDFKKYVKESTDADEIFDQLVAFAKMKKLTVIHKERAFNPPFAYFQFKLRGAKGVSKYMIFSVMYSVKDKQVHITVYTNPQEVSRKVLNN